MGKFKKTPVFRTRGRDRDHDLNDKPAFKVGDTVRCKLPKESRILAVVKRVFQGVGGTQVEAQTKRGHTMIANEDWFNKVVWTSTDGALA